MMQDLQDQLETMQSNCCAALEEHLTDPADVESVTVDMEFSGRGEFLRDAEDILSKVFPWSQHTAITDILKQDADPLKALQALNFMKQFTPSSVAALVDFWKACNTPPDICNIRQTILPNGQIHMTIDCEEF